MRTIAIIPARGGSRRIPGKNIKDFHGKPIMAYSIELALQSRLFDSVYVSTEDEDIARVAVHYGAILIRRANLLAVDDIGTQEVAAEASTQIRANAGMPHQRVCVIYATAPLMREEDLRRGFELLNTGARFALAVGTAPLADAGQFYWGSTDAFERRKPLISEFTRMIPIPRNRVCDINTPEDWARAEAMYEALHRKPEQVI